MMECLAQGKNMPIFYLKMLKLFNYILQIIMYKHFPVSSSSPTCTTPKGIPFLSERSKHRVEAADNAGDDDGRKLERLLIGEGGSFEDILREVNLL